MFNKLFVMMNVGHNALIFFTLRTNIPIDNISIIKTTSLDIFCFVVGTLIGHDHASLNLPYFNRRELIIRPTMEMNNNKQMVFVRFMSRLTFG